METTEIRDITLNDVFGADGFIAQHKPGYEVRQPQIQVAELAEAAIREQKNAIIEAGTGTGKSFALAVPAVLSGKRAVISTETNTLLDQYINNDLPFLQRILPKEFKFAKAKGKSNYVCKMKRDEYEQQGLLSIYADHEEVSKLVDWSYDSNSGDRSEPRFGFSDSSWQAIGCNELCPRKQCPYYIDGAKGETECFAYKARKAFLQADVIVTNHTLMLLNAQIGGDAVLGDHSVLIVDEAHTLAEQAQKTFGFEIKQRTFSSFCKYAARLCHEAKLPIDKMFNASDMEQPEKWFFEQFRRLTKQQMTFKDIPALILGEMEKASLDVIKVLEILRAALNSVMPNSDEDEKLLRDLDGRAVDHIKSLKGLFNPDENWLPFCELSSALDPSERTVTLHYKPVDVAPLLQDTVYDWRQSTILASATMSVSGRFDFPIRDLGLEEPLCLQVESPFDYPKQCTALYPTRLPDPQSPEYHTAVAEMVTQILTHTHGRAFVLFTSYRDLQKVYELVSPRLRYEMMKQGDLPKPAMIERFKSDVHSVLFATRSFFTGVDIPGEALSCVILVKAPFRPPDEPLFRAKCELVKARGGNDFMEVALPLMVNDLRQAFGRLIRSKSDTGMFAFLDSRAINKPYFRHVLNSLPTMKVRTEL